jgi:hypothetical protein
MIGKLGKHAPRLDPRTFRLERYLDTALPAPPKSINWGGKVPTWPMYDNDTIGDCVCAGAGHLEQTWTANAGTEITPAVSAVLQMYEQVGGYVPGDPSTDNGCDMLTACKWLRSTGLGGRKIAGFVSVPITNPNLFNLAIFLFGGVYLGLALPLAAQDANSWSYMGGQSGNDASGSWGGHCVPVVDYDANGYTVVTWGQLLRMGPEFLRVYGDEAYALLSPDWIETKGVAPMGFNLAQLEADLAAL